MNYFAQWFEKLIAFNRIFSVQWVKYNVNAFGAHFFNCFHVVICCIIDRMINTIFTWIKKNNIIFVLIVFYILIRIGRILSLVYWNIWFFNRKSVFSLTRIFWDLTKINTSVSFWIRSIFLLLYQFSQRSP